MLPLARITAVFSFFLLMAMSSLAAIAQDDDARMAASPLRLSYVEGEVSFWREGAENWVEARHNTPLAAGDALYVGRDGDLELQMSNRAFVRADDETQLTLLSHTADFVQFKVTSGRVSFDLRSLPAGFSVEVDTPNAVFTIERSGYYRVDVNDDVHFITRRGGRAMMVPAGGQAMSIHPSEEIVVQGGAVAQAETYVAPELDRWDRWNYERTNDLADAVSERYLPAGIAGAYDLDHYGRWRVVEEYGPVWVPDAIQSGWAPYSTGRWVWDPFYQWTWIDDAPWGWAPYHYGRWVYLGSYWGWAPGPAVRAAVYAPALVAFFGVGTHASVGIGVGAPGLAWVALGWGEPLIPWWGRPGFVGRPWWGGWHGPRVINNVVVQQNTVININNITYHNTRINHAIVATTRERFGKSHVHDAPVRVMETRQLKQLHGALPIQPEPATLAGGIPKGARPPDKMLSRPVLTTSPAREANPPWNNEASRRQEKSAPEPRYVPPPGIRSSELPRPGFGVQAGEERARPPLPPRFQERRREAEIPAPDNRARESLENSRAEPLAPHMSPPEVVKPPHNVRETESSRTIREQERKQERLTPPEARRIETVPLRPFAAPEPARRQERIEHDHTDLPGQPANRMYRGPEKANIERQHAPQQPDRPARNFRPNEARPQ